MNTYYIKYRLELVYYPRDMSKYYLFVFDFNPYKIAALLFTKYYLVYTHFPISYFLILDVPKCPYKAFHVGNDMSFSLHYNAVTLIYNEYFHQDSFRI